MFETGRDDICYHVRRKSTYQKYYYYYREKRENKIVVPLFYKIKAFVIRQKY